MMILLQRQTTVKALGILIMNIVFLLFITAECIIPVGRAGAVRALLHGSTGDYTAVIIMAVIYLFIIHRDLE
jgi:hypothetical protein